jgi:hypothetical protein
VALHAHTQGQEAALCTTVLCLPASCPLVNTHSCPPRLPAQPPPSPPPQLSTWLASAFPRARLSVKNGCIPATPAAYMYMCLELSVEREVDLLFVEYLMNDGFEDKIRNNSRVMVYERLVRKVMAQMNHPAVALYQVGAEAAAAAAGHVQGGRQAACTGDVGPATACCWHEPDGTKWPHCCGHAHV